MSQGKRWCYTLNNYETEDQTTNLNDLCHYHVCGKEQSESGTPHLQGFIYLIKPLRLLKLKELQPTAHWEIAKGSITQNYNYCTKEKQFVEYGERPLEKGRAGAEETKRRHAEIISMAKRGEFAEIESTYPNEYLRYHSTLKRIRQDNPTSYEPEPDCTGEWYSGKSGSGKSHHVREKYRDSLYKKPINKWWDGYQGQDTVLLEDVDMKTCEWLGYYLKIWGDKYDFPAEIKGSTICIRPKRIVITSQYAIHEIFEDEETRAALHRRFKQFHVNDRRIFNQSEFNPANYGL